MLWCSAADENLLFSRLLPDLRLQMHSLSKMTDTYRKRNLTSSNLMAKPDAGMEYKEEIGGWFTLHQIDSNSSPREGRTSNFTSSTNLQ